MKGCAWLLMTQDTWKRHHLSWLKRVSKFKKLKFSRVNDRHVVFKSQSTIRFAVKNNRPIFSLLRYLFPRYNLFQLYFAVHFHIGYITC